MVVMNERGHVPEFMWPFAGHAVPWAYSKLKPGEPGSGVDVGRRRRPGGQRAKLSSLHAKRQKRDAMSSASWPKSKLVIMPHTARRLTCPFYCTP
jgi:hypothetical protein